MKNQPPRDQTTKTRLVHVDSRHPFHSDMFKTLVLLAIDLREGPPAYFVVEGCAEWQPIEDVREGDRYHYEEHTCPTNFIRIPMISHAGDTDPHGLFRYVDTIWMTSDYDEHNQEAISKLFPALKGVVHAE